MMVLTLLSPWAQLVKLGLKRWETRSWRTAYRGPLLIHASSKAPSLSVARSLGLLGEEPFGSALHSAEHNYDVLWQECGRILCITSIMDCIPTDVCRETLLRRELQFGDFSPGRWAWKLGPVTELVDKPKVKGRLGLWRWEPPPGWELELEPASHDALVSK